ncbi:MAG: sulfotransferase [Fimbriimonadaceae bacterium]
MHHAAMPSPVGGQHPEIRAAIAEGRLDDAADACRRALQAAAADAEAMTLMGLIALRLRRGEAAETSLRSAIDIRPDSVEALTLLASYYRDLTRFREAKELCLAALRVEADSPDALVGLGLCLLEEWQNTAALAAFDRAVAFQPDSAAGHDGRGVALQRLGRMPEARAAFERAVELDPDSSSPYVGLTCTAEGAMAEEGAVSMAIARLSNSGAKLCDLGRAFWLRARPHDAARALRAAIEVDPASEYPRRMLARILEEIGEFEAARSLLQEAVAANPTNVLLYEELAFSTKFGEDDRVLLAPMTTLLRNRGIDPADRRRLNFALGKAYDDLGEYGRAMQHFDEANGIAHMQLWPHAFDRRKLTDEVDAAIEFFTPSLFEKCAAAGNPSDEPLLIVGMIRSGTTLVEQIISSHPAVAAAGEVTYLLNQAGSLGEPRPKIDLDRLAAYAAGYLERLRAVGAGLPHVTDKMPQNFAIAGLIHLALPNARIVHTRREALDTCLSIYVTPSTAAYTHAFADIAFYFREYRRLMAHWREVLPKRCLFELDYESLVADRESVVRRLIEFLDLPWDDAVMRHEGNARSIETPSKWQARQPLYATSVARWRRYAPWIGDLLREFPEVVGK